MPKSYSSIENSSQYTKLTRNNVIKPARASYLNAIMKINPRKTYTRSGKQLVSRPLAICDFTKKISKKSCNISVQFYWNSLDPVSEPSFSVHQSPKNSPSKIQFTTILRSIKNVTKAQDLFKRCRTKVMTRTVLALIN